jgi:uncharacterized protein (TIGR02118 family)
MLNLACCELARDNNKNGRHRMAKLLVLYKKPKSAEAFDKHYASVHIPLAKKIPGLKKYDISTGTVGTPAGPSGIHLTATLYFDSLDALKAGLPPGTGRGGRSCQLCRWRRGALHVRHKRSLSAPARP